MAAALPADAAVTASAEAPEAATAAAASAASEAMEVAAPAAAAAASAAASAEPAGDAAEEGGAGDDEEGDDGKKKRKRKRGKRKKKGAGNAVGAAAPLVKGSGETGAKKQAEYRGIKSTHFTDYYAKYGQSEPPSVPVAELFTSLGMPFPEGEHMEFPETTTRVTAAEAREVDAEEADARLLALREGAEVHRQTRAFASSLIKPGIKLRDMCEALENKNRELVGERGLERGIAFPTGCSLNHVAAHYTPNGGDDTELGAGDVMKVDFGTQINGHIIDSAWTVSFDPRFDALLEAVREATEAGIRAAGVDVTLGDVGAQIQEVMESFEVELEPGRLYPVKAIQNLNGHSIAPYQIHAGKSVPIVANGDPTRMEAGELFAIETFGSINGRAEVHEDLECSHYMKNIHAPHTTLRLKSARNLLSHITKTFGTLGFCRRWLERDDGGSTFLHGTSGKQERYMGALRHLCEAGLVDAYPPLCDVVGSYTAQYEHTIVIKGGCKEVVSRGTDY
ncbi:MAP2B [Symbiodinium sp. KB8]|nr:MAP2B [Symbiodinium sp. KB8]